MSAREQEVLRQRTLLLILLLHRQGCRSFYVNCSPGLPLWAGEMIVMLKRHMKIRLLAAVPGVRSAAEQPLAERISRLVREADTVTVVSPAVTPESLRQTDHLMLLESDVLLYWGDENAHILHHAEDFGVSPVML